jgi:hypothetical protein
VRRDRRRPVSPITLTLAFLDRCEGPWQTHVGRDHVVLVAVATSGQLLRPARAGYVGPLSGQPAHLGCIRQDVQQIDQAERLLKSHRDLLASAVQFVGFCTSLTGDLLERENFNSETPDAQ